MPATIRLTMAQALTRFLTRQVTEIDGAMVPLFGGVWAIFGHGNVAALGEALYQVRDQLPTFRAHNEQGMALAAVAYAKASFRRRMMACTTSIGPGATNMITAAAVAHVDRLPVLLLPAGLPLFRPHHAPRADRPGPPSRHAGFDRSGQLRTGDAGSLPGRSGRGLRLSGELF